MQVPIDTKFLDLFPDARPIFVVGAARSGTSIVCDALRFGAGLPGNRESFVMSTAYLLLSELDGLWQRIGPGLQHFADEDRGDPLRERSLARFDFATFLRHCLRYFHGIAPPDGEEVWVAKTPDIYMVHATPMLAAAYPRGRWVWVQRNGVEVMDSRRRTHPEMTFEEGCRDWATVVEDWHRVQHLVEGRWLQVDQHEVATRGAEVAANLASFLGLDDTQRDGIERAFAEQHPGRTTSRDYQDVLSLAQAGWPPAEKQVFRDLCGKAMQLAGYAP